MTLCRSVSEEISRNRFHGTTSHVTILYLRESLRRLKLTHVLENQINILVIVCLVQPNQPDDVLVIDERQQEHNLAERTLRVRLIPESIKDLFHRNRVLPFLLDRLPYYTIGLCEKSALLSLSLLSLTDLH